MAKREKLAITSKLGAGYLSPSKCPLHFGGGSDVEVVLRFCLVDQKDQNNWSEIFRKMES